MTNTNTNIKNKGTGAGGLKTNENGLPYEELTDLVSEYTIVSREKYHSNIKFVQGDKIFKVSKQANFFKCMKNNANDKIVKAHGCKNPDECFIDEDKKIIFIIEKKFQQVQGSVCEKIQTPDFKIWQYSRTFPEYKIVYMYCLSDWFKTNCVSEIEYLNYKNVPIFWGTDIEYKNKIINFMLN